MKPYAERVADVLEEADPRDLSLDPGWQDDEGRPCPIRYAARRLNVGEDLLVRRIRATRNFTPIKAWDEMMRRRRGKNRRTALRWLIWRLRHKNAF